MPEITKRKVTMTRYAFTGRTLKDGQPETVKEVFTDHVRPDFLEAYLDARRPLFQTVEVSDEPDAGPGGYHGATHVPADLNHPLAGQTFPATKEGK